LLIWPVNLFLFCTCPKFVWEINAGRSDAGAAVTEWHAVLSPETLATGAARRLL
jgi:hypothetical protein